MEQALNDKSIRKRQHQTSDETAPKDSNQAVDDEENFDQIDSKEEEFVESILDKFLIGSESTFLEDINILLVIKALPTQIADYMLKQLKMLNFNTLQNSLVSYQNAD